MYTNDNCPAIRSSFVLYCISLLESTIQYKCDSRQCNNTINSIINYLTKVVLVWYNKNSTSNLNGKERRREKGRLQMALTKAGLKEILSKAGVPAENIAETVESILDGHVTSINALREEIATYKADAEKLPSVQKELDTLKSTNNDEWETKYKAEHESFEQYKLEVAAEKELNTKKQLYTQLLKEQNVDEKRFGSILKVTDFNTITVKDGKLADTDKLVEAIKSDWSGFIVSQRTDGAPVDTPPGGSGAVTKADFEKMSLSKQMEFANTHADVVATFYKE